MDHRIEGSAVIGIKERGRIALDVNRDGSPGAGGIDHRQEFPGRVLDEKQIACLYPRPSAGYFKNDRIVADGYGLGGGSLDIQRDVIDHLKFINRRASSWRGVSGLLHEDGWLRSGTRNHAFWNPNGHEVARLKHFIL